MVASSFVKVPTVFLLPCEVPLEARSEEDVCSVMARGLTVALMGPLPGWLVCVEDMVAWPLSREVKEWRAPCNV